MLGWTSLLSRQWRPCWPGWPGRSPRGRCATSRSGTVSSAAGAPPISGSDGMPNDLYSRLNRQLSVPDDAIGTEIIPAGQCDERKTHLRAPWRGVDQRPYLRTAGVPDAPHHLACPCWHCGDGASLSGPAQHEDGCVCWDCEPQRWRGERHRRLLRILRRQREIYDAQNSRTGVYDLLPYLSRVGTTWLSWPAAGSDEWRWARRS